MIAVLGLGSMEVFALGRIVFHGRRPSANNDDLAKKSMHRSDACDAGCVCENGAPNVTGVAMSHSYVVRSHQNNKGEERILGVFANLGGQEIYPLRLKLLFYEESRLFCFVLFPLLK